MIGTKLAHYEITSHLGSGGMGDVYQATDSKLGRSVAIKLLPEEFTHDAERAARFEREARVLASLNNPNIAAIYGIEQSGGRKFLVMELVEGETLAERIRRGPIPVEESLRIVAQIADALEAAHDKSIIHRDLKPANVVITPGGKVKVLDFGLAKAEPSGDMPSNVSQSPTLTSPALVTGGGIILGTAAYMSPEQARGKPVDKRADIWAFGAVLYEMLTGTWAFGDEDVSMTLSRVLQREPDFDKLPTDTPKRVSQVLRLCLRKDARQRVSDIRDVRLALEGAFETAAPPVAAPTPEPRSILFQGARAPSAIAVGVLAGALLTAAVFWFRRGPAPAPVTPTRTSVMMPEGRRLSIGGYPTRSLALSPDGTQLVYVGLNLETPAGQRGGANLQIRSLANIDVRDLPGTMGARQPFFSPDGHWVAFFTASELKKISLAGGNPVTLLEKINGRSSFGVWTRDNTIIFGTTDSGLRRVSAEGGVASDLTTLDAAKESWHSFPALTPSGRAVLFSARQSDGITVRVDAVRLDSKERLVVVENAYAPHVLSNGDLLFQRNETILIAPFDEEQLTVTGPAIPLIDEVRRDTVDSSNPTAELVVSRSGTLAYVPATDTTSRLGLVSRNGAFEPLGLPPAVLGYPRVSPDGQAIAFVVSRGPDSEVRIYDLLRGGITKLTQDGFAYAPAWRDKRSLAVPIKRKDSFGIFLRDVDGSERLLVPVPVGVTILRNLSWLPDGTKLAYTSQTGFMHDVWMLTMGDKPTAEPLLNSPVSEYSPKFSPDGRWLAYQSDASGRQEVYVQPYPKGERLPVSTNFGQGPVWRRDGKELYFMGGDAGVLKMMATPLTPEGASLRIGKPAPLFDLRMPGPAGAIEQYQLSGNGGAGYDVLPDGRFVMVRGADPTATHEIVIVQNWFEELKHRVPVK